MGCPSLTIQSRALYAVDLMLEWRDDKGEWAGVGCLWAVTHVQCMRVMWRTEGAMSSLLLMTMIVLIES